MGTFLLTILVSCAGITLALNSWNLPETDLLSFVNAELDQEWMFFKKSYNKTYVDANEEVRRRLYWEDSAKFMEEHNLKYDRGEVTYTVTENDFSDMADDEFEKIYLQGLLVPEDEEYPEGLTEPDLEAPRSLDWRRKGYVSPVKNQGPCGSCWAFSAVGALEGQTKKFKGKMVDFSEQNLVDCSTRYGNHGCRGGWMNRAFRYIRDNKGIDNERCYPYRARDMRCTYKSSCNSGRDYGSKNVPKSTYSLQSVMSKVGPIAIAMDVSDRGFRFYRRGVYNSYRCSKRSVNHAMLGVGYGSYNGSPYWLIKNSWGTGWGDRGYVKTARERADRCGVASWASYPVVRRYDVE